MKLFAALTFFFPLAVVAQDACLTDVNADTDYFPTKVSPSFSKSWDIEYFNTYKILTNIHVNETYLLYQCGSEIPASEVGRHAAEVEIPIGNVGIDVTPSIPFLELLGKVDDIVSFTSDPAYVSSPCLLESIQEGNVLVLQSRDEVDEFSVAPESSATTVSQLQETVGLISPFNSEPTFSVNVKLSEYTEKTNAAIFEWIKFYSALFNQEEKANEVFDATQDRWNCIAENAQKTVASDGTKPVVLWAYYSSYCGGWSTGTCPNYYCEYATQCSAELLANDEDVGEFSDVCGAKYMSTEQLVEFGKDADHWIFPSNEWDTTYEQFKDQLQTMKSVQNMQVYDYQASGGNAWFEQRYPEYFAVLQDFCSIVGTTTSLADKSWFRSVMDGSPIGDVGTCTENSRSNSIVPVKGAVCDNLVPMEKQDEGTVDETDDEDDDVSGANGLLLFPVYALVAAAVMN